LGTRLEPDHDASAGRLRDEILQYVEAVLTLCEIRRVVPATNLDNDDHVHAIIDHFVSQSGCAALGSGWLESDRANALVLLQRVLEENLAYGVGRLTTAEAARFAGAFLDLFPSSTRYFTNGTLGWHRIGVEPPELDLGNYVWGSWNPILEHLSTDQRIILDTGIIAISPERIGLLWLVDQE
jgi:hypothetical protein